MLHKGVTFYVHIATNIKKPVLIFQMGHITGITLSLGLSKPEVSTLIKTLQKLEKKL